MSATAGWDNFFVAMAGASAALAGLLFVAVSINLPRILSFPHLPGRAAEALMLLVAVLLASTFGLVPGQSARVLGAEVLATGAVLWLASTRMQVVSARHAGTKRSWTVVRVITSQAAIIPFLLAGSGLVLGMRGAVYWLVPAIAFSVIAGVLNAWVLLVEIQR